MHSYRAGLSALLNFLLDPEAGPYCYEGCSCSVCYLQGFVNMQPIVTKLRIDSTGHIPTDLPSRFLKFNS